MNLRICRLYISPLILVVVAGCSHDYAYQYVSLIGSMDVLEYGEPEVMGIREHSDMPIRYKRAGEQYTLYALIDTKANRPTVIFSGEGKGEIDVRIDAAGIPCYLFLNEILPVEFDLHGYSEGSLRFYWDDRASPQCESIKAPTENERIIKIAVLNDAGSKIGEEEIYFEIATNGIKREYDTL